MSEPGFRADPRVTCPGHAVIAWAASFRAHPPEETKPGDKTQTVPGVTVIIAHDILIFVPTKIDPLKAYPAFRHKADLRKPTYPGLQHAAKPTRHGLG